MRRALVPRSKMAGVFLAAFLLAVGAPAFGVRAAAAQPAEFLPPYHALYEELESLVARGLLPSFAIHTRPLARADIARALLDARGKDSSIESDLHYQRLERELARELEDAGSAPRVKETGPLLDVGGQEERFRVALAGHARGDFEDKREIHYRLRDESSLAAR